MRILLTAILVSLLAACAHQQTDVRPIVHYEVKPIKVPEALLKPCPVDEPPAVEFYSKAAFQEKENLLAEYTINLLKTIHICNEQLVNIKRYQEAQVKILAGTK